MATVPAVAYLGDRYKYLSGASRWNEPMYDKRGFEDGAIGTVAQNNLSGLKDGWSINAGNSEYVQDPVNPSNKACKTWVNEGGAGDQAIGGSVEYPERFYKGDVVYQGARFYFASSFDFTAVNDIPSVSRNKTLRLQSKNPATGAYGYNDLYIVRDPVSSGRGCQYEFTKEGERNPAGDVVVQWYKVGDMSDIIPRDQWLAIQYEITVDNLTPSEGGQGMVRVFIDGEMRGEFEVHTINSAEDYLETSRFFPIWDDRGASSYQEFLMDDAFVSNTTPDGVDSQGNPRFNQ